MTRSRALAKHRCALGADDAFLIVFPDLDLYQRPHACPRLACGPLHRHATAIHLCTAERAHAQRTWLAWERTSQVCEVHLGHQWPTTVSLRHTRTAPTCPHMHLNSGDVACISASGYRGLYHLGRGADEGGDHR